MEEKVGVSSKTLEEIDESRERGDMRTLEAVFFVSGRFLNMQELVSLSDLNPISIRELIVKLKEKFDRDDSALEIVEKNGLWKMDVKSEYSHVINKLATGSAEFSKAEQETLAIIAFKQPIKQSVMIKIRGNKAYDHLKKFSDLGLIKKKKEGHTYILSLSDDFYDYFNVADSDKSLKEIVQELEGRKGEREGEEKNSGGENEFIEEAPKGVPPEVGEGGKENLEAEDIREAESIEREIKGSG